MRNRTVFAVLLAGIAVLALIAVWPAVGPRAPKRTLAGLEMTKVGPGRYNLTILVPNSFGRKYHSKPVTIRRPFEISRHEITIDQWNLCHAEGGCPREAKRRPYQTGSHPVTRISWLDAVQFTRWLSAITGETYRLPTEEEWAYAAFAGEDVSKDRIENLIAQRQMIRTATFTAFRPTRAVGGNGENPWSIADMTGSVWEWTLTCWFSSDEENRRPWTIEQLSDPALCANRVVQGDERAHVPFFVDKVYAGGCGTGGPVDHIGFRVVRDTGAAKALF
tara:strand:- start:99 stop:929 length:831 start_codon:yes stop_codon:yes gene_type:complete